MNWIFNEINPFKILKKPSFPPSSEFLKDYLFFKSKICKVTEIFVTCGFQICENCGTVDIFESNIQKHFMRNIRDNCNFK